MLVLNATEFLQNYNPKNTLVQQIKFYLTNCMKIGENVAICWFPAPVGITGNEADKQPELMRSLAHVPISDYMTPLKNHYNQ